MQHLKGQSVTRGVIDGPAHQLLRVGRPVHADHHRAVGHATAWATITGQCACEATCDTVDPRIADEIEPWPRDPITTMTAVRLCSTRTLAVDPDVETVVDRDPCLGDDDRRLGHEIGSGMRQGSRREVGDPDIRGSRTVQAAMSGSQ